MDPEIDNEEPVKTPREKLEEMLAGIDESNQHELIDLSEPVGKEML